MVFLVCCGMSFIGCQVAEGLAFHREDLVQELYTVLSHCPCHWPHTFPVYVWVSCKKSINFFAKAFFAPFCFESPFSSATFLSCLPLPPSFFKASVSIWK